MEHAEEFALVRDFAIIMAAAGLAVVLFRRLNQPPILGYLLAGVIVGPFTLPNPPVENLDSIRLLADLGLVLLLFAVGLEFGWRRIRQVGFGVVVIGAIEMIVMISVGYQAGQFLGWTAMESVFLGSALSISSSAILVKVLRDSGQLRSTAGRIIVGILVVEDFVAVVLLTLLSGVANTGTAELSDVGMLVVKLVVFGVASLALGAVFVPRIINFVAQFKSPETMLLSSLALCFTLALVGQSLGISAAAGAFLIGAVVGDTNESEQVTHIIEPVRDMFGALFFVSIGMLIDPLGIAKAWDFALIVTIVFMAGKMFGDTVGTFVSGQSGRTSIQVGMGTPQIGEFSLAIVKVGVEHEAIRQVVYQVIAGVTALNSLIYPFVSKSSDRVADFLERRSPDLLKRYVVNLSIGLSTSRSGLSIDREFTMRVRASAPVVLINLMIIVVLVAVGTFAINLVPLIGDLTNLNENIVGNAVGFAVLALCFPSTVSVWRGVRTLADDTTTHLILRRSTSRLWVEDALRTVIRDTATVFVFVLLGLWSIPLVTELLSLGALALPVPIIIVAAIVFVAIRSLKRIHHHLVETFSRTFLGTSDSDAPAVVLQESDVPHISQKVLTDTDEAGSFDREPTLRVVRSESHSSKHIIAVGDAELIALATVRSDRSPYGQRLKGRDLVWDILEVGELPGLFKVRLAFREEGDSFTDAGEEELYMDRGGIVQVRQIRRWPRGEKPGFPLLRFYLAVLAVLGIAIGIGAYILFQSQ